MQVVTKGEFARLAEVSPGRVSQWISEGKIGADALQGEGRSARIIVERALAQVRLRRDVGQGLGNGIGTRLFDGAPEPCPPSREDLPPRGDDVAYQIQLERLQAEKRKNRQASIEEAEHLGQLVPADAVRAQMARLARQVDEANAAMLADFANAISGRFSLPQRDVLHLLRATRNEKKGQLATVLARAANDVPETVEVIIEGNGEPS